MQVTESLAISFIHVLSLAKINIFLSGEHRDKKKNGRLKYLSVAKLLLDEKNPRLGTETTGQTQREIIQYLFDHDKALEIVRSIVTRGYFESEPLLAISEQG